METRLAAFANNVWKRAETYEGVVRLKNSRSNPARRNPEELNHHCTVALFLAQQELPNGTETEVWNRALSILRKDLIGNGTMYEHQVRLEAVRKAMTADQRWNAWGEETVDGEGIVVDAEQASDTNTILEEFMEELKAVLSEKEFTLLEKVYVGGLNRAQLVDELALEEPKYASPEGRKQAMNRINVAIHRARKKAMTALPERWQAFAEQAK